MDNEKGELLAGSYVQVRFKEAKLDAVLSIPANALLFRNEGTMVGVIGADNRVALRTVTMGRDFGMTVEIIEGVTANDRVILIRPIHSWTARWSVWCRQSQQDIENLPTFLSALPAVAKRATFSPSLLPLLRMRRATRGLCTSGRDSCRIADAR